MPRTFKFNIKNHWSLDSAQKEREANGALKTHHVFLEDGKEMEVSAAKHFKGDASKYNPEELLMAALSSCHFMSYMYVCQKEDIAIIDYKDKVSGFLELKNDGSGAFTKIILRPQVTLKDFNDYDAALQLHENAAKLCFIANSCSFSIIYEPTVSVLP